MAIIFFSKTCEGCTGNHALANMQARCKSKGVDFEERRTILWERYEQEANEIMENSGIKLPFFYGTESNKVLSGNTLTTLDEIDKLIKEEINATK